MTTVLVLLTVKNFKIYSGFSWCYFCADVHENVISKVFREMVLKAILYERIHGRM